MAEDVDTGSGRHWSGPGEGDSGAPPQGDAPEPARDGGGELPGPPPTTLTPSGPTSWPIRPEQQSPSPSSPPQASPTSTDASVSSGAAGTQPWTTGVGQPVQQRGPAAQPPGPPAQQGQPQRPVMPPPPMYQRPAMPPGQHQHNGAVEQRGDQYGQPVPNADPTMQIPFDPRLRQAGGPPYQQRYGAPQPDQYSRPAAPAPIQAASAGVRQELIYAAIEERSPVAHTGWRGSVNAVGLKLKPSKKERRRLDVYRRIRAPKDAMYAIAVLTLKGGAGKTTITATLGQVFSSIRADGVVAVDADPDAGDLPLRTAMHRNNLAMPDLLREQDLGQHDTVQRFLSTTDTDLHVLANGWRPDGGACLEPEDIKDVHHIASHYYSMLLWDADKALNSAVVGAVLAKSNALVLIVEASIPGAQKASLAIDWLRNHGFEGLLARTVLVVNETTANARLDMDTLMSLLARQQLKIHHIPYDKHLDEGLPISLDKLRKKTRREFENLAAVLADDFSVPQPPAPVAS